MQSNANQMYGYICEKSPTYPRHVLIDTSMKDNLQENQYPTCTKAGHCTTCIMRPLKQQIGIIFKLENTICTTIGIKLTLLDVVNGKALCRMSQVFPPSLSKNTNGTTLFKS